MEDRARNPVRIRRKLESETLHLPEVKALIGKNVEIIVQEKQADDTGCFSGLPAPKPLSEKERPALRELFLLLPFKLGEMHLTAEEPVFPDREYAAGYDKWLKEE